MQHKPRRGDVSLNYFFIIFTVVVVSCCGGFFVSQIRLEIEKKTTQKLKRQEDLESVGRQILSVLGPRPLLLLPPCLFLSGCVKNCRGGCRKEEEQVVAVVAAVA